MRKLSVNQGVAVFVGIAFIGYLLFGEQIARLFNFPL